MKGRRTNLEKGIMRYLSLSLVLLLAASCGTMRSAVSVGHELADATSTFLSSLDDKQRELATRELSDNEAVNWHFVPGRYAGVEMGALSGKQKALAHQVLRTMLSATGFAKAMAIADLENVLHGLESKPNKPAVHRDPNRYALLVCGTPNPARRAEAVCATGCITPRRGAGPGVVGHVRWRHACQGDHRGDGAA
jgi:hypothetical protein